MKNLILIFSLFLCFSCEKEIDLNLPESTPEIVVEASLNNRFPTLNYVYITSTLDYFDLNLEVDGLSGAEVFISEGVVNGKDTIINPSSRIKMSEVNIPGFPKGLYTNPNINPISNHIYKLDINYRGKIITGMSYLSEQTEITDNSYVYEGIKDNQPRARIYIRYFDPPEPSYYRLAYTFNKDSNLIGWGGADRSRVIDDENFNNSEREYNSFQDFRSGDTVNIYLGRIGNAEYRFWESYQDVRNSDGPFSTPAQVKSNLKGAIGSFTCYGMEFKKIIIKP